MRSSFDLDFVWQRDADGYEFAPGATGVASRLLGLEEQLGLSKWMEAAPVERASAARVEGVAADEDSVSQFWVSAISAVRSFAPGAVPQGERIIPRGGRLISYRPKDIANPLFTVFAGASKTREGLIDFTNRFGLLTHHPWSKNEGEEVQLGLTYAAFINAFLAMSPEAQSEHLGRLMNGALDCAHVDLLLTSNAATARPQLKFEFGKMSLINYLLVELGLAVSGGANIQQCRLCSIWFEAGSGRGRRKDAQYCCDEHRILYNSRNRKPLNGQKG